MPGDHLAAGSEIGTVALASDLRELQAAYLSVRETDPAMTLDSTFKVKLFWVTSRANNCFY